MPPERLQLFVVGAGIALIYAAWTVVYMFSVPVAILMTAVAMVLPPLAALVVRPMDGDRWSLEGWEQSARTPGTDGDNSQG
jgi:hypothetical protein